MSPTPPAQPSAAELLNAQIRALWTEEGGHPTLQLDAARRAEYHRLLAALAELQREDIVEAA
ncbi:hypothetical protein [Streptomyces sp. NPDC060188]|uniref:hypothetical protein n=1 Tax=Streptomyces sp. NPDC060188 TaxID=3347068 RepID=UPI003660BDC1